MNVATRVLVAAVLLAAPGLASAQVVRIEQDWEITVNNPDSVLGSPQISLWLKPDPAVDFGGLLQLNFRDYPHYVPGGVQLQAWDGDTKCAEKTLTTSSLTGKGEKITVTVFMETKSGQFSFGVMKGKSPSLGEVKSPILVTLPTTMTHLNKYSTQDTVDNSKIMAGDNRVQSMKIIVTRTFDSRGNKQDLSGTNVYP